jgi:hypothetical protein
LIFTHPDSGGFHVSTLLKPATEGSATWQAAANVPAVDTDIFSFQFQLVLLPAV